MSIHGQSPLNRRNPIQTPQVFERAVEYEQQIPLYHGEAAQPL